MKRLILVLALAPMLAQLASVGAFADQLNPQRLAILRWYGANQTAEFRLGTRPVGVAFDGAHIWTANVDDGTVSKRRAADGAELGTFNVGGSPYRLAFDGASIWVSDDLGGKLTKLRAADGSIEATLSLFVPLGLAFDGTHIWVAEGTSLTRIRAKNLNEIIGYAVCHGAYRVAFDGRNIWVSCNSGENSVRKVRPSDGVTLATYSTGQNPQGLAFDGVRMWVANSDDSTVTSVDVESGELHTYQVGVFPTELAFDGADLWVAHGNGVTKLSLQGVKLGTVRDCSPTDGIAFDGANIWATSFVQQKLCKY